MPYVALPPASLKGGPARTVALWHPLGAPAWRVYFGLHGTSSRALDLATGSDLVLDIYTPMVEQAAAEFVAARAELCDMLPIDDGPVAVVGSSAGAHTALRVLTADQTPAAAVINPAVRTESVVTVNERFHDFRYTWTEQAR
jgi:dienelactone hydrolase